MSEWVRAWHRYRRQNRFLVASFLALLLLSLAAVYLMGRTQAAAPGELTNRLLLFVLWYLDISLILVLLFILLRNLLRLAVERRAGVLGSRFRTKLVVTYVALTFVPVLFIFLIATNLLQRSIDRWFAAPVEEVLRSGASVTASLRELVEHRLGRQAEVAAAELAGGGGPALAELQALLGVDLVALYVDGDLDQAVTDPRRIPRSLPPLPDDALQLPGQRADRWRGGLLIRAWAPVPRARGTVVVVGAMLPREVLLHLERTSAAYATFQEMKLERGTVASTTVLVFLAVTLLLLFATVWVGLYLSRRFTEPLLAVAAATQRVAEGSQLEEVAVPASDETAVLLGSFNAMVRRVRATEAEMASSNQELAALLATVPTGVLTVDAACSRVRANPAAARLLGERAGVWLPVAALDRPGLEPLHALLCEPAAHPERSQLEIEIGGTLRQVEVTARPLPGGGWVLAADDLTQLLRAQRQAAWSEVARRIAHEIKNPLTPIRLEAERIQRHARHLEEPAREVLTSGCEAIVAHVAGLKELVDAFHLYAKMPAVNPRPTDAGQLLREVVRLYQGLREDLQVRLELPAQALHALLDPVLLRQALVNLLDNAVEASPEGGEIVLRGEVREGDLVLEVADRGIGLPSLDPEVLVQPFYSTKGRGSGMGLAVVHRIVSDHGGSLELGANEPHGARVRLVLPRALAHAGEI